MDQMLKNELGLSKTMKFMITAGLTGLLALSVFFCCSLYANTQTTVRNQAIRSITNISQLNKDSVRRPITNRRFLIQTIAARLEEKGIDDVEEILEVLEDYRVANDFYSMGVITREHQLHLTNGRVADISGTEFDSQVWDGQFHLSASYQPYAGGKYQVNAFTYPVYYDGELKYVLLATYYSKKLTERMNFSSMEGKGFNFIINRKGEVVIYPYYYEDEEYNALMKYINDTASIIPSENGDIHFDFNNECYYAHFEELGINDWVLMTCTREIDLFAEADVLMRNDFLSLLLLWLIIAVALGSTVCSIIRSRRELRQTFFYDELLGIGNLNALSVYFKKMPPEKLSEMHLVVFDVDKFKEFNYIYGNESGDKLLQYIVQVFHEEVPEVYLFRYEADCFVTLDVSRDTEEMQQSIQKVLDRYARDIAARRIQPFDTSAGVRRIEPDIPVRQLVSDAIIARDAVKGNHLRHHAFYNEDIRVMRTRYMEMESALPAALLNREFYVYYQPKYDLCTGEMVGAEALARWIRSDGTVISPSEFIPCFEDSRQIVQLDEAMLTEVCRQMQQMQKEGLEIKPVSVNLSRVHLQQPDVLKKVTDIIRMFQVDASKLAFEITESALLEESIPLKDIVDYLHALGCRVDMDDYGVGASGPKALASNCFDVVKLDKSFVDDIGNSQMEAVIGSTISLARKLGLEVLAEGVEEKHQAERLLELGCQQVQGFYFSKPVTERRYRVLLKGMGRKKQA